MKWLIISRWGSHWAGDVPDAIHALKKKKKNSEEDEEEEEEVVVEEEEMKQNWSQAGLTAL